MMSKLKIQSSIALLACLSAVTCQAQSALGDIIVDEEIAAGADISVLSAEANSIDTIGKGIALSLALCEGIELCTPNVNRAELEALISTLDSRIGNLGARYDETGDQELEPVLIAYADVKESYTGHLEKLGTMVVEEPSNDLFGEDDFLRGINARPSFNQVYSIFNDADQEITDDIIVDEEIVDDEIEADTSAATPAADAPLEEQ